MYTGSLDKMNSILENPVKYSFVVGDKCIDLNDFIGLKISIDWLGNVSCVCGKSLNKFYRQNFCYQCFWNSPLASQSIFKPELCNSIVFLPAFSVISIKDSAINFNCSFFIIYFF